MKRNRGGHAPLGFQLVARFNQAVFKHKVSPTLTLLLLDTACLYFAPSSIACEQISSTSANRPLLLLAPTLAFSSGCADALPEPVRRGLTPSSANPGRPPESAPQSRSTNTSRSRCRLPAQRRTHSALLRQKIQSQHRQECQTRRQNSSAQGLIDAAIHDIGQLFPPHQLHIFANAVKNHDRVVIRIAD